MSKPVYSPPYIAKLSEKKEKYLYTWEEHKKSAWLDRAFVDVFKVDGDAEERVGEFPVGTFKGARSVFQPILHNGNWYALTSKQHGCQVYSLPDMKLVAETPSRKYCERVTDIYCPRLQYWPDNFRHAGKLVWFWQCFAEEEIEEEGMPYPWTHADFAFVEWYDPLCSGSQVVEMLNLKQLADGVIEYVPDAHWETPEWLSLRQSISMKLWRPSEPRFQIVTEHHCSTVNGSECGGCGWTKEQFGWPADIDHDTWVEQECKAWMERTGVRPAELEEES